MSMETGSGDVEKGVPGTGSMADGLTSMEAAVDIDATTSTDLYMTASREDSSLSRLHSHSKSPSTSFKSSVFFGDELRSRRKELVGELRLLSKLRHPCITTMMGAVVERGSETMLVMELMEHGSLYDMLHNQSLDIDGEFIHPILQDVVQGMRFLHASQPAIVHGDLKSQNILVDRRCRAKVTDFGLSRSGGATRKRTTGTPFWMAPELLAGRQNTPASDVYAFGIILNELYARELPYAGQNLREVVSQVRDLTRSQDKRPAVPAGCPLPITTMMQDSWHKDESLRPTFEEISRRLQTLTPDDCDPTEQVGACGKLSVG
jgi:serine/threonine protein kinase